MANKRHKPPGLLADQRPGRVKSLTVLPVPVATRIPRAPKEIGKEARAVWKRYWSSPISQVVDMDAHGEGLKHWVRCLDARQKLFTIWRERPLVKGSHGQIMANPVWRQVRELSEEIARAEEAFGMNPLAQLRLGVTFLAGRSMAEDLRRRETAGDEHKVDDIDPRKLLSREYNWEAR